MNLNRENYELLMFDLLEGNLSESDELIMMKQIEEDEFFFREWKLFKATVLIADEEVVFENKKSLMKKEEAVLILPIRRVWMSVAASICILAVAYILWPATDNPLSELAVVTPQTQKKTVFEPDEDLSSQKKPIAAEQISASELPIISPKDLEENLVGSKMRSVEIASDKISKKEENLGQDLLDNSRIPHDQEIDRPSDVTANVTQFSPPNDSSLTTELLDPVKPKELASIVVMDDKPEMPENQKITETINELVTNNSPRRIKEEAIRFLTLISNPKVRLKPNFKSKRPSLEIEVETEGYYAVASLVPFKNRNN